MAANLGEVDAYTDLGRCYKEGYGTDQDFGKAFQCYKLAAEKEIPGACFNLAECYRKGIGTSRDSSEAIKWYKLAAGLGDEDAASYLEEGDIQ